MPSYLVTGANGAIGFEFVRQISASPDNIVIALVRSPAKMEERLSKELPDRKNVYTVQGDLADYDSLAKSVEPASKILNGSLDYLIANAALLSPWAEFTRYEDQAKEPQLLDQELTDNWKINVAGNIHLFNLYIPLLRKGTAKKVIAISSGLADTEFVVKHEVASAMPYTVSKAALNMVVAKYHAEYAREGLLFLSLCPGAVDNGNYDMETMSEERKQGVQAMFAKFLEFAPHFTGHTTPEKPVTDILRIADRATLEDGWGGSFSSHNGGRQWL